MKVGCSDEKETFEIPDKDLIIKKTIVAIVCPVCKQKAYMAEIEVYPCVCGRVWCVD